jgi:hypothetical protein
MVPLGWPANRQLPVVAALAMPQLRTASWKSGPSACPNELASGSWGQIAGQTLLRPHVAYPSSIE